MRIYGPKEQKVGPKHLQIPKPKAPVRFLNGKTNGPEEVGKELFLAGRSVPI